MCGVAVYVWVACVLFVHVYMVFAASCFHSSCFHPCSCVPFFCLAQALGVEITTSKCSAINVVVSGGEELNETNIPEQFVSRFKDGVLVTEPMKHSSA